MDEEHRSDVKRFPKLTRWDHPKTLQRFFMDVMCDTMKKLRGRYCDAEVADLSNVMFGLPSECLVTEGTERERRRMRGFGGHGLATSAGNVAGLQLGPAAAATKSTRRGGRLLASLSR
jgi:hypothetical protein